MLHGNMNKLIISTCAILIAASVVGLIISFGNSQVMATTIKQNESRIANTEQVNGEQSKSIVDLQKKDAVQNATQIEVLKSIDGRLKRLESR